MSSPTARELAGWARTLSRVALRSGLVGHASPRAVALALQTLRHGKAGLSTALRLRALTDADRPAFVFEGATWSYGAVDARIARLSAGLAALGIGRGDAVALALQNRPEFFELEGAMARRRGAAVSVSWRSTAAELAYLLQHSGAKALCFEPAQWPVVEAALAETPALPRSRCIALGHPADAPPGTTPYAHLLDAPPDTSAPAEDDGAVVIYTSGTTGKPKGAVRRFGLGQALGFVAFLDRVPFHRTDRHLCVCPLYHSTALGFAGITLMTGGCVVIERHFEPLALPSRGRARAGITTTALVPTMLHRLMALDPTRPSGPSTRAHCGPIVCGGALLPGPLATRTLDRFGPVLYNFYGATETGLVTVATPDDLARRPGHHRAPAARRVRCASSTSAAPRWAPAPWASSTPAA
jgi:fatty-acyl-CoA synthase